MKILMQLKQKIVKLDMYEKQIFQLPEQILFGIFGFCVIVCESRIFFPTIFKYLGFRTSHKICNSGNFADFSNILLISKIEFMVKTSIEY
jgi:hypothetical protein